MDRWRRMRLRYNLDVGLATAGCKGSRGRRGDFVVARAGAFAYRTNVVVVVVLWVHR
jgi:hypothetical protein